MKLPKSKIGLVFVGLFILLAIITAAYTSSGAGSFEVPHLFLFGLPWTLIAGTGLLEILPIPFLELLIIPIVLFSPILNVLILYWLGAKLEKRLGKPLTITNTAHMKEQAPQHPQKSEAEERSRSEEDAWHNLGNEIKDTVSEDDSDKEEKKAA